MTTPPGPGPLDVRRATTAAEIGAAGHLFDDAPTPDATAHTLAASGHHLLIAWDGEAPAGFVTGVEITHPDKGTEMLVYELGVDDAWRRRGVARALLDALDDLARARGCRGGWVLTEPDNLPARATYASRAAPDHDVVLYAWDLDDEA